MDCVSFHFVSCCCFFVISLFRFRVFLTRCSSQICRTACSLSSSAAICFQFAAPSALRSAHASDNKAHSDSATGKNVSEPIEPRRRSGTGKARGESAGKERKTRRRAKAKGERRQVRGFAERRKNSEKYFIELAM